MATATTKVRYIGPKLIKRMQFPLPVAFKSEVTTELEFPRQEWREVTLEQARQLREHAGAVFEVQSAGGKHADDGKTTHKSDTRPGSAATVREKPRRGRPARPERAEADAAERARASGDEASEPAVVGSDSTEA